MKKLFIISTIAILLACSTLSHNVESYFVDSNIPLLKSRNQDLENRVHPYSDVFFTRVTTQRTPDGETFAIIVPQFEAIFEAILPEELFLASDDSQKIYLNKKLKDAVSKDRKLRKHFSALQLRHIDEELVPIGYVWHHDAPIGKMQLVELPYHFHTGHTGGREVWGGGKEYR